MTIGEKIKTLRKKHDMTQEKLADFLSVSYQAVSKWECGAASPDLSLIVPLAKLLHVSTDELLGMKDGDTDERKQEYDAVCAKAHFPEQLELAQNACRDYPGELKYLEWQADCLYMLAYEQYTTQEKFYDDLEKALKPYLVVLENADDDELKNSAIVGVVNTLSALRRNDEAVKYAEMYPAAPRLDKNTVMGWALTGEAKERHMQNVLKWHLDDILRILTDKRDANNPNLHREDCLDCAEKLLQTFFPSGEYNFYYDDLYLIYIERAVTLARKNPEKAIESLKTARRYAETLDDLFMRAPTAVPYNSPFFDLLRFDSADLLIYGPLEENRRTDNFSWWLSGKCFDPIRERKDFQELLNG